MTAALGFDGKISAEVKAQRLTRLQKLQNEHSIARNRMLLDAEEEVLVEGISKNLMRKNSRAK